MTATFVIDCSVTMAWCFEDEATPRTDSLLDRLAEEAALVPTLWFLEVANVLTVAERRKRVTPANSDRFLSLLTSLPIESDGESSSRACTELVSLSRTHGITSYDAAYLDVALRHRLPLASLDVGLRRCAKSLGIKLLGK
ncbi:MAG: type II toxin-antitoxin system VapC family toxin [Pirellulales bacterium]